MGSELDLLFVVFRSGKYTLSIRSILELEGYLEERFAEHSDVLDHCERCQKLVTAVCAARQCIQEY